MDVGADAVKGAGYVLEDALTACLQSQASREAVAWAEAALAHANTSAMWVTT